MRKNLVGVLLCWLACAGGIHAEPSMVDLQGKSHSLAAYRGKWVLINLWATWCSPCLREMPELDAWARSRPDVVVLGIATDGDDQRRLAEFARRLKLSYPIVAGNEVLAREFRSRGLPTTLLFNPAGKKLFTWEGVVTGKMLDEAIDREP
jgi:thiol-disulfide isomerase/thioredoxin